MEKPEEPLIKTRKQPKGLDNFLLRKFKQILAPKESRGLEI